MHRRCTAATLLALACTAPAWAQTSKKQAHPPTVTAANLATAKTPTECKTAADALTSALSKHLRGLVGRLPADQRDSVQSRQRDTIKTVRKANALACTRRFDAAQVAPGELDALIDLYDAAGQRDLATAGLDRAIAVAPTTEARAAALAHAVQMYTYNFTMDEDTTTVHLDGAEPYLAQLDALGDAARGKRIEAHAMVAHRRVYFNVADSLARVHADAALALARTLTPDERNQVTKFGGSPYVSGITAAANVAVAEHEYGRAIAILNEGIAVMGGDTSSAAGVRSMVTDARRAALVGTPAPAIVAEHWLNALDGSPKLPLEGHVTLVEFTTTWCGWCKRGYPTIRRLAAKYAHTAYQPVFVSLIEGAAKNKPDTVDAELAYDQAHWVGHDSIAFPIAVLDTQPGHKADTTDADPVRREDPTLFRQYLAQGYPTYVFVDKHGTIRDVQVGHAADLNARFTAIIDRLLTE